MEETIVAISTALGEGAIGIIRLSGLDAKNILSKIFFPVNKKPIKDRMMTYGYIKDENNNIIDEVLAVFMPAPRTYTREDIVEINCHGSLVSQKKILDEAIKNGARLAEAGEFTKRAFLNGRIDLSRAEAVIDLIKADTDRKFEIALSQLEGSLSNNISEIRNHLLSVLAQIMVNIDFPDEDIEEESYENLLKNISLDKSKVTELLDSAFLGKIYKEGIRIAIVGKPNVGKSSLLNALVGENRAIVTDIPGTTRDTITEKVMIGQISVVLTDTAGMRDTDDLVEKIGIDRSKNSFNESQLQLLILDSSIPLDKNDIDLIKKLDKETSIIAINKVDIADEEAIKSIYDETRDFSIVKTCFTKGEGLRELKNIIEKKVFCGHLSKNETEIITNTRHKEMLAKAHKFLTDSERAITLREPFEIIEIDVKAAYESLGKILGESLSEDIINEVFSKFCLGK